MKITIDIEDVEVRYKLGGAREPSQTYDCKIDVDGVPVALLWDCCVTISDCLEGSLLVLMEWAAEQRAKETR